MRSAGANASYKLGFADHRQSFKIRCFLHSVESTLWPPSTHFMSLQAFFPATVLFAALTLNSIANGEFLASPDHVD